MLFHNLVIGCDCSHPVKLSSQSQKWRAFPQTSAERFTFLPAFESNVPFLNAMSRILVVVEFGLTEPKLRTVKFCFPEYPHDCKQSFALFWSSVSGLSVRPLILVVEFEKAETQAFLALSARLSKSLTAKLEPSSSLNAFSHILVI